MQQVAQGKLDARLRGLKLDIKQEPFAGAERDKQIKTTVTVSPNTTVTTGEVPLGGGATNAAFPYKISKVDSAGQTPITRVGRAVQYLRAIKMPFRGKDPSQGYVVNMIATPDKGTGDVASKFLALGWQGAGSDNVAASRTAVIVGVNKARSVVDEAAAKAAVSGAVSGVAKGGKLLMAAFGMLWTPAWTHTEEKRPATFAEVAKAAKASPEAKALATTEEQGLREKEALP